MLLDLKLNWQANPYLTNFTFEFKNHNVRIFYSLIPYVSTICEMCNWLWTDETILQLYSIFTLLLLKGRNVCMSPNFNVYINVSWLWVTESGNGRVSDYKLIPYSYQLPNVWLYRQEKIF